jgi:hypothetical protein
MVAKKKKDKRKKRKGKDDRTLIISNLPYYNLIFCGLEWTEEKWQSQGICGYILPPFVKAHRAGLLHSSEFHSENSRCTLHGSDGTCGKA